MTGKPGKSGRPPLVTDWKVLINEINKPLDEMPVKAELLGKVRSLSAGATDVHWYKKIRRNGEVVHCRISGAASDQCCKEEISAMLTSFGVTPSDSLMSDLKDEVRFHTANLLNAKNFKTIQTVLNSGRHSDELGKVLICSVHRVLQRHSVALKNYHNGRGANDQLRQLIKLIMRLAGDHRGVSIGSIRKQVASPDWRPVRVYKNFGLFHF